MKLAGIDGVVIDWYGTVDYPGLSVQPPEHSIVRGASGQVGAPVRRLLRRSDHSPPRLGRSARRRQALEHARREIEWLREHWFVRPTYLKLGGRPILLSFGQHGLSDAEWEDVAGGKGNHVRVPE